MIPEERVEQLARELAIAENQRDQYAEAWREEKQVSTRLRNFAEWVVSLDDVTGPGAETRRIVTLADIIKRARTALETED